MSLSPYEELRAELLRLAIDSKVDSVNLSAWLNAAFNYVSGGTGHGFPYLPPQPAPGAPTLNSYTTDMQPVLAQLQLLNEKLTRLFARLTRDDKLWGDDES